ncbi:MAG: OsmC family protein [Candidatus Eisenbacteria bacterium]|nr:OsmC family protein [Candidatus Eisenbacteria bacterium]
MVEEFRIRFEGKARVVARYGDLEIATDQRPEGGGEGTAPEPFTLFLASLGTCAGIYVRKFCETRGISTSGIQLTQTLLPDAADARRIGTVRIAIRLPDDFPSQYRDAVIRAAEGCAVKKYIQNPFRIETVVTPATGER